MKLVSNQQHLITMNDQASSAILRLPGDLGFHNLNDYILVNIFRFLSFTIQSRLKCVCSGWNDVLKSPAVRREIVLVFHLNRDTDEGSKNRTVADETWASDDDYVQMKVEEEEKDEVERESHDGDFDSENNAMEIDYDYEEDGDSVKTEEWSDEKDEDDDEEDCESVNLDHVTGLMQSLALAAPDIQIITFIGQLRDVDERFANWYTTFLTDLLVDVKFPVLYRLNFGKIRIRHKKWVFQLIPVTVRQITFTECSFHDFGREVLKETLAEYIVFRSQSEKTLNMELPEGSEEKEAVKFWKLFENYAEYLFALGCPSECEALESSGWHRFEVANGYADPLAYLKFKIQRLRSVMATDIRNILSRFEPKLNGIEDIYNIDYSDLKVLTLKILFVEIRNNGLDSP